MQEKLNGLAGLGEQLIGLTGVVNGLAQAYNQAAAQGQQQQQQQQPEAAPGQQSTLESAWQRVLIAQQIREAEEAAKRKAWEEEHGRGGRGARSVSPGRGQPTQKGPRPFSNRGGGQQTQI
eukprot:9888575-Prorocentrum_lima.AAC.1